MRSLSVAVALSALAVAVTAIATASDSHPISPKLPVKSSRGNTTTSPPHILMILADDYGWANFGKHATPEQGKEVRNKQQGRT